MWYNVKGWLCFGERYRTETGQSPCRGFYNASDSAYEFRTPLRVLELGGMTKVRDLVRCEDMESVEGECVIRCSPMVC